MFFSFPWLAVLNRVKFCCQQDKEAVKKEVRFIRAVLQLCSTKADKSKHLCKHFWVKYRGEREKKNCSTILGSLIWLVVYSQSDYSLDALIALSTQLTELTNRSCFCAAEFPLRGCLWRLDWVFKDTSCDGTQRSLLSQSCFSLRVRWAINTKILLFHVCVSSGDILLIPKGL